MIVNSGVTMARFVGEYERERKKSQSRERNHREKPHGAEFLHFHNYDGELATTCERSLVG